jgi:multiple sugar transport system permease protein
MSARREIRDAYLLNMPLILFSLAFILIPVAGTLIISLFRDVTYLPLKFLGATNYRRLLLDGEFWQSVRFTLQFVVVSVGLELVLGVIFALVLHEAIPGRGILRVAILIPWAIPVAISARIWELIYNFEYGVLNWIAIHGGFAGSAVHWLGTPSGAFIALVLSDVWKTTPFVAIILLAGLSTIPEDLYRQAMIDGTGFSQRFFHITLPLLRPVIVVALLFRTIDALRMFDLVYVLTGGGPGGSTTSLSLYAFRYYLNGDFGYGSAVSVLIFLLASLLAVLYIRFGRFMEALR